MNCRGTTPPTILLTNSRPQPDGERLHLDVGDPELAVAAGLLHVPAQPLGLARDRLPQRHPQLGGLHRHPVPRAQPVEQQVRVGLAHAPQHQLAGLGVHLQPQRRVLGHQPPQRLRQLVLVRLRLGRDRHRQQRLRHRPRLHQQRLLLVDRVSPVSALVSLATAPMSPAGQAGPAAAACRAARSARPPARRCRGRRAPARPARARTRGSPRPAAGCRRTPGPG